MSPRGAALASLAALAPATASASELTASAYVDWLPATLAVLVLGLVVAFGWARWRTHGRRRVEENSALLSHALNSMGEAAFLVDQHGRFLFVNDQACRVLEYGRDELLGLGVPDIDPDFPAERWRAHWAQLVRDRSLVFEGRHRTKSGRLFPVEVNANFLEYRGAGYNLALVRDITERRRIGDALRASEERYRRIIDTTAEGILALDASEQITFVNDRTASMLGCTADELLGRPLGDFVFDEDRPDHRERMAARRRGVSETYERRLRRRDGQRVWAQITAAPVLDPTQGFTGSFAMLTDTTQRRRNEAVNAARLHLVRYALTHSLAEVLEETLNRAEELTGSRIGFYHLVDDDQRSVTLQAWSSRTKAVFCKAQGEGRHYAIGDAGVWADAVRERRPVVHNDYPSLPHRRGTPAGHAEVARELVVPVLRGDTVTAVLGIGNKAADYDEVDVEVASALADLAWEIAVRKRVELALEQSERRYRLVFENSPVSIWEEDFSKVKAFLDDLRREGVADLDATWRRTPTWCGAAPSSRGSST